jgi:protocatechuate 3,4-dioxygenase beta subunit
MTLSRRRVLALALQACALIAGRRVAAQGLGGFATGPPPCKADTKPTPSTPAGSSYRRGSPARSSLVEPGTAGATLLLTGSVTGLSCGPIAHALMDFWQADARGVYDQAGFRFRGRQFTDATGRYRLTTVMPGAEGDHAPVIHVRIDPPGRATFTTAVFFAGQPQNTRDPIFRPELAVSVTDEPSGKTARFDVVLDV